MYSALQMYELAPRDACVLRYLSSDYASAEATRQAKYQQDQRRRAAMNVNKRDAEARGDEEKKQKLAARHKRQTFVADFAKKLEDAPAIVAAGRSPRRSDGLKRAGHRSTGEAAFGRAVAKKSTRGNKKRGSAQAPDEGIMGSLDAFLSGPQSPKKRSTTITGSPVDMTKPADRSQMPSTPLRPYPPAPIMYLIPDTEPGSGGSPLSPSLYKSGIVSPGKNGSKPKRAARKIKRFYSDDPNKASRKASLHWDMLKGKMGILSQHENQVTVLFW